MIRPHRLARSGATSRRSAVVPVAVIIAALALLPGPDANAHANLAVTSPAADARLTQAPARITLSFGEFLQPQNAAVVVTGPDARTYANAPAITGDVITAPLHALRVAGSYTVDYRAMSASGHSIVGSYAFTYEPPEDSATQRTPTPGGTAASSARGAEATTAPRVDGILVERAAGVVILLFAAGVVLRLIVRARRGRG